jgi:hypothetical protein
MIRLLGWIGCICRESGDVMMIKLLRWITCIYKERAS